MAAATHKQEPLKVLFLIPSLAGGGAERVITTLVNHLDRNRFRPILAVVNMRGAVFQGELRSDVELIDLNCARVRYALPKIAWIVWHIRPKIVFSTLGHLNLTLAMIREFFPRDVRVIGRETTVVSYGLKDQPSPRVLALGYRHFYSHLDHVVSQSKYMRDDLISNYSFPEERVTVINNPVDAPRIRQRVETMAEAIPYPPGRVCLVAAGRLVGQKGFDLLIQAVALCGDLPLHLAILGVGPMEDELVGLARLLGIEQRVQFLGFQENPFPYFAAADAFVLSSHYEGFPNVVLEALACGTPVIAMPAPGGVREILDDVPECEMADEISAEALAKAIRRWVERAPGRVTDECVAKYTMEQIVGQYEQLLSNVAAV